MSRTPRRVRRERSRLGRLALAPWQPGRVAHIGPPGGRLAGIGVRVLARGRTRPRSRLRMDGATGCHRHSSSLPEHRHGLWRHICRPQPAAQVESRPHTSAAGPGGPPDLLPAGRWHLLALPGSSWRPTADRWPAPPRVEVRFTQDADQQLVAAAAALQTRHALASCGRPAVAVGTLGVGPSGVASDLIPPR
jgi:hypothetical protein